MKKTVLVVVMLVLLAASVFATPHKKQKIVWCHGDSTTIAMLTTDASGKAYIKDSKMPKAVIPDGWHVEHMQVFESKTGTYTFMLVIEEN